MIRISKERQGEFFILAGAFIWSIFPVVTILTYKFLPPISALAWATLFSCLFFAFVLIVKKSWRSIYSREILIPLAIVTGITGILFYVLFFLGLQYTSANNAAIIATLEIFFTYLFFNVWKKELFSDHHIFGMLLVALSGFIIFLPSFQSFQKGDFLILLAVLIVPLGNYYQKNLRNKLSSEQILFCRTFFATPFLFWLAYIINGSFIYPHGFSWFLVIMSGIVIFGLSKVFWLEGIFRISVTKAISLSSISPVLTICFAYFLLSEVPTLTQIVALVPAIFGIYLLTRPGT